MSNIGFVLPNNVAAFRYSFIDTGGTFPADVLMVGGNKDTFNPFVAPACDELRITITFTESVTLNRLHLSRLNMVSGLTFVLSDQVDTAISFTAPSAMDNPTSRRNYNFRFADTALTELKLTITGIAQAQLNIGQITAGAISWTPSKNYINGAELQTGYQYNRSQSFGGTMQRISSKARAHRVGFERLADSEHKALKHLVDYQSKGGLVVYEKDITSELEEDSYLAYITPPTITETLVNENSFSVDIIEAIT